MDGNSSLGPLLVNSFGDRYLYELNGAAFDKIGSEASFLKHFDKELFEENSLYVIVGSDSGLLPQHIIKQGLPEGSYYIFIEPPAVLDRLKEVLSEHGLHKKIIVTNADEWVLRAKEIEFQNFVYLGNLKFFLSFAATDGRYSDYLDLSNHLQEELEKIRWGLNAELGAELFHLRQLENLPENQVSAVCLQGTFKNKMAIVLAGGPSLDEVLSWVIENRDSFVVIAVSRIARRLLEVDLSPDLIVSVDPNQLSFDISKEMLELWEKTVFINKYHVVSTLLGQWCGRSLFLGPRVPWDSPLNEGTIDSPGPTVTNSAIDLAVKMGCGKVFLAGVDLCHSRDGYTHAQGSNERRVGPQLGKGQLWIETNGGWMAETTPDFHFAATQIGTQANLAKQQGCQIVNLSENSAKMDEVEYVSLSKVKLSKLPNSAIKMILESIPSDTIDSRSTYYQKALNELIRAQNSFREIKKLSVAGLKANDVFFGRQAGGKGNHRYKAKMDRIEKKLKKDFSDFSPLVKKFGIRGFLRLTQGDQDREWDRDEVERLGRIYYEAYRDSAGRLLEIVDEAGERMRTRLEEEKAQPDFQQLFARWTRDQQPGRSLVWKYKHPQQQISEDTISKFNSLGRAFKESQQQQETSHMQRTRNWSEIGQVRGKLLSLFKQKQTESLNCLVDNLANLDGAQARSLYCLGKGYLAELDGKVDNALAEYQQLFDIQEQEQDLPIMEDALRCLLNLSLQREDYGNAKIAAECLSGISVIYLPYYADLLWLLGEKHPALDLYANYLDRVPDDLAVMMKLGRYYQELGVKEGAELMFSTVLEKDSNNIAAKTLLEEMSQASH